MGSDNSDKKNDEQVRVKRPVERQRMRPWLINLLNDASIEGLTWENKEENTFKINWKHGSRHGYNVNRDASLFEKYAELTGRKDPKNPNPKKWKANFRCALHSLNDVEELKSQGNTRGHNAFRVYKFLDSPRLKNKVPRDHKEDKAGLTRKRKYNRRQRVTSCDESDTEEDTEDVKHPSSPSSISAEMPSSPAPNLTFMVTEEKIQSKEPGITTFTFPKIFSGCTVITRDVSRSASAPIIPSCSEMVNRPIRPSSHESISAHSSNETIPAKRRRINPSPIVTECDNEAFSVPSLNLLSDEEDTDDESGRESDSEREVASESESEAEVQNVSNATGYNDFAKERMDLTNDLCVLDENIANEEVVKSIQEAPVYTELQPPRYYSLRSKSCAGNAKSAGPQLKERLFPNTPGVSQHTRSDFFK